MNLIKEFSTQDKCSYLKDKEQTTHYKLIDSCDKYHSQELISRGYRRFGKTYFRPICPSCDECKSIKIDVENFTFSSSQKRVLRKASKIKSYMQTPSMTQTHLDLYKKYHLYMKDKKGWDYHGIDPQRYYDAFVSGHEDFGYEVLYFDEQKLIGVDLIDILEDGISSIYFYYDPEYSKYSLGKLSLLQQVKIAKTLKKSWIYLGYYVKESPSLSYKAEYKPFLTLQDRPTLLEKDIWR
ncbi:MAG: arginyltransferase [Epsilonproteobacteria bacterium]|nr:arginyltransferase [Campylobacterota bacterium]